MAAEKKQVKIYRDDPVVPYKSTTIKADHTRHEIDGILARWGIKRSGWEWDPTNGKISLTFQIEEDVDGKEVKQVVRVETPIIWEKANRKHREYINWDTSMRIVHWYLKTHLEYAYLSQSPKVTEFLPNVLMVTNKGEFLLKDVLVPRINQLTSVLALPEVKQ